MVREMLLKNKYSMIILLSMSIILLTFLNNIKENVAPISELGLIGVFIISVSVAIVNVHLLWLLRSSGPEVFFGFLLAHWLKVDQKPDNLLHRYRLAFRTLAEGQVQFPDGHKEDHSRIDDFLGPAQDFGEIRK